MLEWSTRFGLENFAHGVRIQGVPERSILHYFGPFFNTLSQISNVVTHKQTVLDFYIFGFACKANLDGLTKAACRTFQIC